MSDEEFDFTQEEDIAMLVAMHKRKKRKHGGSMFGREFIQRELVDAHERCNYFGAPPFFYIFNVHHLLKLNFNIINIHHPLELLVFRCKMHLLMM